MASPVSPNRFQSAQPDWVYSELAAWLFLSVAVAVFILVPAVFPVLWIGAIYAAVATYQDLRRFGRSTFGWTTLVVLFGAFAYVVFVYKRPGKREPYRPVAARLTSPGETPPDAIGGQPVPGWYADPKNESRLRYWDGTAWTDNTAD